MKKAIFIGLFSLFSCSINYAADEQKAPGDLKNTLLVWNKLYDSMNKRLTKLENNYKTKVIEQKEFNRNNVEINNSIKNLNARINKVEETSSLLKTNNIAKSFKDTINILNKKSAEIEKRLETLEVNVSVIEKIYQVSQSPLETLMKIIDEQAAVINKIEERLAKQEKMLLAMGKGSQDSVTKRKQYEEPEFAATSIVEKISTLHETGGKREISDAARPDTQKPSGSAKDIFVKNIGFYSTGSATKIRGEIENKSNRDYSVADIEIQFYDEDNDLLESLDIITVNLHKGSTNKFDQFIFGVDGEHIAKYIVLFNNMILTTYRGEIEVKSIEKKDDVEDVVEIEDRVSKPVPVEEKTTEVAYTEPLEDEGLKAIGKDFYIRNVTFSKSGSSTIMKGEIKNDSRDDISIASFSLKVVGKDSDKKFEKKFTIINFSSNGIKKFEQTIDGILPSQVSDYKIVYKGKR